MVYIGTTIKLMSDFLKQQLKPKDSEITPYSNEKTTINPELSIKQSPFSSKMRMK